MTLVSPEQRDELEAAIIDAGHEILGFWPGGQARPMQVKKKPDGSLVTDADYASNRIIVRALERIFPNDGIFSEEMPKRVININQKRVWLIDPLDGTKSFVEGNEGFSILVALCEAGAPVAGGEPTRKPDLPTAHARPRQPAPGHGASLSCPSR